MSKPKYKIYNGKSLKIILENSRIVFLVSLFITGLIVGALILKSAPLFLNKISLLFDSYSMTKGERGIINNFIVSFAVNGLFIITNTFLGFSVIGYPFIMMIPLLKALGLGAIIGYLYSFYKLSGLGYCVIMIIPGALVSSFALIQACNDSCDYSRNVYFKAIKGRGQYEKDETRVYLSRQLVFSVICAISSAVDAVTFEVFSGFFEV